MARHGHRVNEATIGARSDQQCIRRIRTARTPHLCKAQAEQRSLVQVPACLAQSKSTQPQPPQLLQASTQKPRGSGSKGARSACTYFACSNAPARLVLAAAKVYFSVRFVHRALTPLDKDTAMSAIHDFMNNEVKSNDVVLFMKGTRVCRSADFQDRLSRSLTTLAWTTRASMS